MQVRFDGQFCEFNEHTRGQRPPESSIPFPRLPRDRHCCGVFFLSRNVGLAKISAPFRKALGACQRLGDLCAAKLIFLVHKNLFSHSHLWIDCNARSVLNLLKSIFQPIDCRQNLPRGPHPITTTKSLPFPCHSGNVSPRRCIVFHGTLRPKLCKTR